MNTQQRQFIAWVFGIILAGTISSLLFEKGTFLRWLAMNRSPGLDYFFYYATRLGEPVGFVIVGVVLWLTSWRKMIFVPLLGGAATVVAYVLKRSFDHERPSLYLSRIGWDGPMNVLDYYMNTGHQSFPSGHSMAAWALFVFLGLIVSRPWVSAIALLAAVSVSLSRVYLMVHFLQDVVAGAAVGTVLAIIAFYLHERWQAPAGITTDKRSADRA